MTWVTALFPSCPCCVHVCMMSVHTWARPLTLLSCLLLPASRAVSLQVVLEAGARKWTRTAAVRAILCRLVPPFPPHPACLCVNVLVVLRSVQCGGNPSGPTGLCLPRSGRLESRPHYRQTQSGWSVSGELCRQCSVFLLTDTGPCAAHGWKDGLSLERAMAPSGSLLCPS